MRASTRSLSRILLFSDLPGEALDALEEKCLWQTFKAGEEIIGQLESSRNVFLIVRGVVSVLVFSAEGQQVTFRELQQGQQFGEFAALDGAPRSASVVARTDCCLAQLSSEDFRTFAHEHPIIMERLLQQLIALARQLSERIFEFSTMAASNRIRAELLRLSQAAGVTDNRSLITNAPTHEQIATRVSTHREAVSRELSVLRQRGILERRSGKTLAIHDVDALSRLLHDTMGPPIRISESG
ncbi:Crp/Fnr family transcriptional regulator [Fodinicurvata halophila]|uniref:Crp/Fnr family transcriptional regulator n=1 Tax=Fodinicurvata halophila TaxID=1419723 RepID=A0ABV8UIY9_9PROT